HPEQSEGLTHGDEGHRRQEEEQAARKGRLGGVVEQEAFREVAPLPGFLAAQVADGIQRRNQEEQTRDGEEYAPERVEPEPASGRRRWRYRPGCPREDGVGEGGDHEDDPTRTGGGREKNHQGGPRRGRA